VPNTDSHNISKSDVKVIASSGQFKIEFINRVGLEDYPSLIKISESLVLEYGPRSLLTNNTIDIYFNRSGTLPFVARFRNKIIGYIIGLPIELLDQEPWARLDKNYGQSNTIYTYAFVIENKYKGNGYAKMLKKVYLNWVKKRKGVQYITGHVKLGVSSKFSGNITIINEIDNWQGTGKTFEYYRRNIDPEGIYNINNNPKIINSI